MVTDFGIHVGEDKPLVMVNGLPGKMARIIANEVDDSEKYVLAAQALTGPNQPSSILVNNSPVSIYGPNNHEEILEQASKESRKVYVIDFTKGPGVADRNAKMYVKNAIPFVMGTTGFTPGLIEEIVEEYKVPCVQFPNMDMQIISLMDGFEHMAKTFAGSWEGYDTILVESHQQDKDDTSGTMKAMLEHLSKLTSKEVKLEQVVKTRNPADQKAYWNVPDAWIDWHAYHRFTLVSNGECLGVPTENKLTIELQRQGGSCYLPGIMRALDFLVERRYEEKMHNTMPDVLKSIK